MTSEEYIKKINELYNGEVWLVSPFRGMQESIQVCDKYGTMQLKRASWVIRVRPTIKAAINKTTYFMAHLQDKHPEIAAAITPVSEYITARKPMYFMN